MKTICCWIALLCLAVGGSARNFLPNPNVPDWLRYNRPPPFGLGQELPGAGPWGPRPIPDRDDWYDPGFGPYPPVPRPPKLIAAAGNQYAQVSDDS